MAALQGGKEALMDIKAVYRTAGPHPNVPGAILEESGPIPSGAEVTLRCNHVKVSATLSDIFAALAVYDQSMRAAGVKRTVKVEVE